MRQISKCTNSTCIWPPPAISSILVKDIWDNRISNNRNNNKQGRNIIYSPAAMDNKAKSIQEIKLECSIRSAVVSLGKTDLCHNTAMIYSSTWRVRLGSRIALVSSRLLKPVFPPNAKQIKVSSPTQSSVVRGPPRKPRQSGMSSLIPKSNFIQWSPKLTNLR